MILTITGPPGTDTRNLCKGLALQLGIKYLPKEKIIERISLAEKREKEEIEANTMNEEFVEKLRQLVLKEAKQDHLILDWGLSTWALNEADLKVFVNSKKKIRAKEMTRTKRIPFVEAKRHIEEKEEEERTKMLHLLGVNVNDLKSFDLVVNSDKLGTDGITGVIIKYLRNAGVK